MKDLEQFSALLEHVYQGATDPQARPSILHAIGDWIGAPKALLFTPVNSPNDGGGFVFPFGISQSHLELWASCHLPNDFWTQRANERGLLAEGVVMLDQDLASESELRASAWYQEFLFQQDIGRCVSGVIFGQRNSTLPVTAISLFRSINEAAFTESDRKKFSLLFPHLSRALGVLLSLRDAEFRVAASRAALDRLSSAVMLFDADAGLSFLNRAAHKILLQQDGLSLKEQMQGDGGRLLIQDLVSRQSVDVALQAAIERRVDVDHFNKSIVIHRPSGARPYTLHISALAKSLSEEARHLGVPAAIAFLIDPERAPVLCADRISALYNLTAAEAKVALHWMEAEDLAKLTGALGLSANTVKTHIKRIYEKMGVNTRAAFVRALLSHADEVGGAQS